VSDALIFHHQLTDTNFALQGQTIPEPSLVCFHCNTLVRLITPLPDIDVVQYGLSLEHIEAEFYRQFKANYTAADFANAGYPSWYYGRYQQVANNELTHTDVLTSALVAAGVQPVVVCKYKL